MSTTISIEKALPQLGDLVEQARHGQTHIITVRDKPCAKIGPVQSPAQQLTAEWRERVKEIRLNRPGQKQVSIEQLIRESRK